MSVSLEEVGALLLKWQKSGQSVSVLFSSEAENWQRSGKVVDVQLARLKLSWDDGGAQFISYSPARHNISEDGRSLHIAFSSGDSVVIFENES